MSETFHEAFQAQRIELLRGPNCWLAFFPGDARVLDAFGSNILPTAWTPEARAEDVLRGVRALNPGSEVVLREAVLREDEP